MIQREKNLFFFFFFWVGISLSSSLYGDEKDLQDLIPSQKLEEINFDETLSKVAGYDGSIYIQSYNQSVRFQFNGF